MSRSNRFDLGDPVEDDLGLDLFVPNPAPKVSKAAKPITAKTGADMGFVREKSTQLEIKAVSINQANLAPITATAKSPSMIKIGRKSTQREIGPRAQITLSGSAAVLQRFIDRAESEALTYVELIDALLDKAGQGRLKP
jgi:hypothetical protein